MRPEPRKFCTGGTIAPSTRTRIGLGMTPDTPPKPPPDVPPDVLPVAPDRADPRRTPGMEARQEQARRQAMADLIEASRGGGLFSFGRRLPYADRREILEKGEAAEAWQKVFANAPATATAGFARIGMLIAVLAALFFGLIILAG